MSHEIPLDAFNDEDSAAEQMKRFRVEAKESTDKGIQPFTPNHKVWEVTLYMDGEFIYKTHYQCHKNMEVKAGEVWLCNAHDAMAFAEAEDLADFLEQNCYDDNKEEIRKGIAAYESCKRTHEVFRAKGINPLDLAGFLDFAESADSLNCELSYQNEVAAEAAAQRN